MFIAIVAIIALTLAKGLMLFPGIVFLFVALTRPELLKAKEIINRSFLGFSALLLEGLGLVLGAMCWFLEFPADIFGPRVSGCWKLPSTPRVVERIFAALVLHSRPHRVLGWKRKKEKKESLYK